MSSDLTENEKIRCCWEGCWRSTTQPTCDWAPHLKAGWHCPVHSDALKTVMLEGGLEGT
jgi:hypothetical protein